MGKTLVVAEKPSAGRDIFAALESSDIAKSGNYQEGNSYVVTWGFGHLAGYVEPEAYGWKEWKLSDLPMVPQEWKIEPVGENAKAIAGAKAQLELIKKLANRKDVDRLVIATDAEREGELIFHFIEQYTGINRLGKPIMRLWTQGTTVDAIREAVRKMKPRDAYRGFLAAGICRAKADWTLGMGGTRGVTLVMRAQSAKLRLRVDPHGTWSVGRVQTPVVALVVDRFHEHEDFVPKDYFRIRGLFKKATGAGFDGLWFRGEQKTLERESEAVEVVKRASPGPVKVLSAESKPKKVQPQCLYSQNSLQKEANKRFGFPLDKTLAICQQLYERKFISYPRSPSNVLPPEMVPELWMHLEAFDPAGPYGAAAAKAKERDPSDLGSRFIKASEAAHYALIPLPARKWEDQAQGDTGPQKPVAKQRMRQNIAGLSSDELAIYDLISRRFLAMFWPDAVESRTAVIIDANGETFRAAGTVVDDPGWYEVDPPPGGKKKTRKGGRKAAKDEEGEADAGEDGEEGEGKGEDEDQGQLPQLSAGEVLQGEFQAEAARTAPPPLFNEGTLVDAMRTAGKALDEAMSEAMAADGKDGGIGTTATRAATIKELFHKKYIAKKGQKVVPTEKGIALIDFLRQHGGDALTRAELTGEWEMALQEVQAGRQSPELWFKEFLAFTTRVINEIKACYDPAYAKERVKGVDIGECPKCGEGKLNRYPSKYGGYYATCSACKSVAGVDEAGNLVLRDGACVFEGCGAKLITVGKFGDFCMGCGEPQGVPTTLVCPVCSKRMIGLEYHGKPYVRCTGKGCQVSWGTDSTYLYPTAGLCEDCKAPLRAVPKKGSTCVKCGKVSGSTKTVETPCPVCGSPMRAASSPKAGPHLRCTKCSIWWHTDPEYREPKHGYCHEAGCGAPRREASGRGVICVKCGSADEG